MSIHCRKIQSASGPTVRDQRRFQRGDWIRYDGIDYQFQGYDETSAWPPPYDYGHVEAGDPDRQGWFYEHVSWLDLADFICHENDLRFFVGNGI